MVSEAKTWKFFWVNEDGDIDDVTEMNEASFGSSGLLWTTWQNNVDTVHESGWGEILVERDGLLIAKSYRGGLFFMWKVKKGAS